MGGRPSVVGCFAVAVALLLVAPIVVPPASAQISIPLPGEDAKPKVEYKKRAFRPTIPRRNPSRVTASIVADASPSPSAATKVEAASAAGAASSAATAIAVTLPPKPSVPVETAQDRDTPDAAANDEAGTAEDTASADTPSAETAATSSEEASEAEETAQASEPQETVESAPSSETASDSASDDAEESATAAEESPTDDAASATNETVDTEKTGEQAEPAEADAPVATAAAPAKESSPPENESPATDTAAPAEAEPAETADAAPEETAIVPSHDATVVLEVSPPPDEVIVAAVTTPETEAPAGGEAPTEAADAAPTDSAAREEEAAAKDEESTELAAVEPTEIAAPEPEAPAEEAETTEDASETEDAAEGQDTSDSQDSAEQPAAPDDATSPSEEAVGEEAVSEEAAVPEPVPAHPIVAAVRANLAGPQDGVAGSDLEALKTFYGAREEPPLWITEEGFTPKAQALIEEIGKADEWGLNPAAFEVPPPNDLLATPNAHADDELQLSIAVLKYARQAQTGRLTPGQASTLFDQNPPLRDPEEVLKEIAASDDPSAYLVSLHPQHDQFKRLRAALQNARGRAEASGSSPDNDPNVQRILINMERWRWMPRSLGAFYVWNNIPEFEARVIKNGRVVYDEKTVVGQVKYATPFFSAPMRSIVFQPNWTVPPTIVKEDIAPKLQAGGGGGFFGGGSSQFLRRHGLNVSLAGAPVDADRVDWRNENVHRYTFTQDPGPANVLGKLKFNFPNRHAIYMHDTVQPELFAERQRTLSHGCIRVQDPGQFATLLLAEDKGWSAGQVQRLLSGSETVSVGLNRLVPVHLTYFTATVDESGNLRTFDDVYGIDNRMAAKMFKNPARFPVPGTPAVLEASTRERVRSPQAGGLDSIISGLFGN